MPFENRHSIQTLTSGPIELDVLLTGGPRIVGLRYRGSDNLLGSVPEIAITTPYGDFHYMGGHRLWYAPEAMPRSYIPDDQGLVVEKLSDGIRLKGSPEPDTGIAKSIEIHLDHELPRVTLTHRLENHGLWEVELAPWAITMFPLGGVAIFPYRGNQVDLEGLLPDRHIAFWPYTKIHDPRLRCEDDFILVAARRDLPPLKIGAFNPRGWLAYWNHDVLFQKQFSVISNAAYPDNGCNSEVYCDEHFIELESLAPLVHLSPGAATTYQEDWDLYPDLQQQFLPAGLIDGLLSSNEQRGYLNS